MPNMRTVGFLDILGFNNLIDQTSLDVLAKRYENIVTQERAFVDLDRSLRGHVPTLFPNHGNNRSSLCTQHIFSDSVILVATEDTETACLALLLRTWRLSQLFLAAGLPLRGAIEYGEVYVNSISSIFLGKALSTAYRTESQQDWVGICINETVPTRYPSISDSSRRKHDVLSDIFKLYPVPFKGGAVEKLHTINWRFNYVVQEGTRSLFGSHNDPNIQRKIDNALAYARRGVSSQRIYAYGEGLPVELRTFYVGKDEPPFDHGDDL